MHSNPPRSLLIGSVLLAVLSAWMTVRSYHTISHPMHTSMAPKNHSYVGEDYPETYPIELPEVLMAVEESRYYTLAEERSKEAWASSSTLSNGYVRLGPEYRIFAVSMFHQFHCLRLIRFALSEPGHNDRYVRGHFQHCLNYMRQMILCHPDLTLEPADVLTRDFEWERKGGDHVCKDWSLMYEEIDKNRERWEDWERSEGGGQ